MKKNYLSVLFVTHPLVAANARGQGSGNQQVLQHLSMGDASHTVINGVAVAYSMRENVKKMGGKCWRLAGATDSPSGFGYGPDNKEPTMTKGGEGLAQFDYDDTALRGFMFVAKGSGDKGDKADKGKKKPEPNPDAETTDDGDAKGPTAKARGCMQMSPAVSATPYDDSEAAFVKGLKEDGQLNPFTFQRHPTRYLHVVTFDLASLTQRPGAVAKALDAIAAGMQVGGSHTSNLSEFAPEAIAWRFHTAQGAGLFLSPEDTKDWAPDRPVNFDPLYRKALDRGIRDEIQVGGLAVNPDLTLAEAFKLLKQQVEQALADLGE